MRVRSRLLSAAHGKFGYLLLALLALIIAAPVITSGMPTQIFLAPLASTVLVAGLYAASPGRRSLVVGLSLAAIDLGIGQLCLYYPAHWLLFLQALLWLITLGFVALVILEVVLASQPATLETLQAAFCASLLLGLVWTYLYVCLSLADPSAFNSPGGRHLIWDDASSRRRAFLCHLIFSYSTMASVGDPGLTPVSDFATICGCIEGMMSQVYLAVVIARLVGLQASRASKEAERLEGSPLES